MLTKLKNETDKLHAATEKENLANKIIDQSITHKEFKLLLLQNYIAYAVTEKEIAKHLTNFTPQKAIQLKEDLDNVNIQTPATDIYSLYFSCATTAEALGALYVVEGSALGGMVIAKHLKKCSQLQDLPAPVFFSGKRENLSNWKQFQQKLDKRQFTDIESQQMLKKAKESFEFFRKIFKDESLKQFI